MENPTDQDPRPRRPLRNPRYRPEGLLSAKTCMPSVTVLMSPEAADSRCVISILLLSLILVFHGLGLSELSRGPNRLSKGPDV